MSFQESLLFVSLPMRPHSCLFHAVNVILCISARTSFAVWYAWGRHVGQINAPLVTLNGIRPVEVVG